MLDYSPSSLVYLKFTTVRPSTGVPFALVSGSIAIYKDNNVTESTSGVTLTANFDSVTGLNHITIDTSTDGTFYSAGSSFQAVLTAGTVDSVSVVGQVVGEFSLNKASVLRPLIAGRQLDVSAANEAKVTGVPSASDNASAVRTNLATELGRIDVATSTRQASSSFAADTRSAVGLAAANLDTQLTNVPANVRTNLATELGRIDATVSSRLAPSGTLARVTLTDTCTTLTNAPDLTPITSSLSDIKGVGWTSSDSLKQIKDAVDAVVVDVTVLPLDATVVERVAGTTINLFTDETPSVAVAVVDSSGAAVDLSGMTLELIIELRPSTDVVVIANASITKNNGSFSFVVPSSVTNAARACKWALRKTTDDSVLVGGDLFVTYAPAADV